MRYARDERWKISFLQRSADGSARNRQILFDGSLAQVTRAAASGR